MADGFAIHAIITNAAWMPDAILAMVSAASINVNIVPN
jgi:hypothetical protein